MALKKVSAGRWGASSTAWPATIDRPVGLSAGADVVDAAWLMAAPADGRTADSIGRKPIPLERWGAPCARLFAQAVAFLEDSLGRLIADLPVPRVLMKALEEILPRRRREMFPGQQ